jgi:DNA-directed RNA polymerase specialized sigma24 family protein
MQEGKSRLTQAVSAVRDIIHSAVREQLKDDNRSYQQIADSVGCSLATVQRLAQLEQISRPVGPKPKLTSTEANDGNA